MRSYFLLLLPISLLLAPHALGADEALEKDSSADTADPFGWKMIYEKDGVKAYQHFTGDSKLAEFKGTGYIAEDFYKVVAVYADTSRAQEWVSDCGEAAELEDKGEGMKICYNYTKLPWPATDRDFVYRETWRFDPVAKSMQVIIKSEPHPDKPPPQKGDKVIRGELLYSEFNALYVSPKETKVMVRIHADPKGSLAPSIVNLVSRTWPWESITNLRKQSVYAKGYDELTNKIKKNYPFAETEG